MIDHDELSSGVYDSFGNRKVMPEQDSLPSDEDIAGAFENILNETDGALVARIFLLGCLRGKVLSARTEEARRFLSSLEEDPHVIWDYRDEVPRNFQSYLERAEIRLDASWSNGPDENLITLFKAQKEGV